MLAHKNIHYNGYEMLWVKNAKRWAYMFALGGEREKQQDTESERQKMPEYESE